MQSFCCPFKTPPSFLLVLGMMLPLLLTRSGGIPFRNCFGSNLFCRNVATIRHCEIIPQKNAISVEWSDGKKEEFHGLWLRDFSPQLVCQQTGQKLESVVSLPIASSKLQGVHLNHHSKLIVHWEDRYQCEYSADFLWKNSFSHRQEATIAFQSSLRHQKEKITLPTISFRRLFPSPQQADETALYEWTNNLVNHGLCLVKDVPTTSQTVVSLAESISPVPDTLYGKCFDVVYEEYPINIAYSNVGIVPHVDLQYYESPPGIQLLHCIQFDSTVEGGESLFVDAFKCAEQLRECDPKAFATLSRVPFTFRKDHMKRQNPAQMFYSRPIISLNHRDEVIGVNWSPPFEAPPRVPVDDVAELYRAYSVFRSLVNDEGSPHFLKFRLQQGECISFLQRRMLHGREKYTVANGRRHLQGCYLNVDDFLSRYLVLRRKLKVEDKSKWQIFRVGNNDFS